MTYFSNTLTGRKELFIPLKKNEVKMYTCGPTVYSYAHIGNFRTFIFEDLLRRYLKLKGYKVKQVMNITDVDDKTIKNSMQEGVLLSEYTKKYTEAFFEDVKTLRIEKAEHYPKATEHVEEMINIIKKLKEKGFTYEKEGSVYFKIEKFKEYGKLSNIDLENVKSGVRYDTDEYDKEDIRDFVLWKNIDSDSGEPFWDSPFGKGRPGWHIECSAMSMKYLGETFDIHTGGVDNIFPHHENEIAQSSACTGRKFSNYWLHCEHLLVNNKKMSKSHNNFYTLRDLKEYNPLAIRYLLLSAHYKTKLNFTINGIKQAENTIKTYNDFRNRIENATLDRADDGDLINKVEQAEKNFMEALDDDLNISKALGYLFIIIREINNAITGKFFTEKLKYKVLAFVSKVDDIIDIREKKELEIEESEIKNLIEKRNRYRKEKNYKKADEIRDKLASMNITIEDSKEGTTWHAGS
ncbi:MAG: cysteine--tRNA ligase [Candidatus Muiribacteriota bacterium]